MSRFKCLHWMRLTSGSLVVIFHWLVFRLHSLPLLIAETYRSINLQMISITKTLNPRTFQIQHCNSSFNIPVQIQFNKRHKKQVLYISSVDEWQDSEQASGMRCISGASSFVPVQSMYECVCGAEAMSKGDSAVIGCLWEEAILLARVSMWISLTENMWKDVQMER